MNVLPYLNPQRTQKLLDALKQRILIIDGAMGTMLQSYTLDEAGYRGERFSSGCDAHHAPRHRVRPERQQRPAHADAARHHRRRA